MPEDRYREIYFLDIVGPLHAQTVWDELHELAGGAEPVLLCWEQPPFSAANWCHRRIVAEWFADKLGVDIAEHGTAPLFL